LKLNVLTGNLAVGNGPNKQNPDSGIETILSR